VGKPANNEFDPKAFLARVGAGTTILKLAKNQHVFEQGDVADTVFYIQKGRVKLTVLSEQGKEAVVGILEPGQFFGEGCLNGHPLRIATTTAMEACVITSITNALRVFISPLAVRDPSQVVQLRAPNPACPGIRREFGEPYATSK
jgi:CRP/FNR family cyclic AMP-dependent transcriptional regulator